MHSRHTSTSSGAGAGLPLALGLQPKAPPYELIVHTREVREYELYLSGDIGDPIEYVELYSAMRHASEEDVFYLYLNSPGGRLDAGLQFINAMRASAATFVAVLDPQAYSMGALIFLAATNKVVPEHASLMLHNYSGGLMGKGNEQFAEVQAANKAFERVMREICYPFLTSEEIVSILNGQDLWLDAEAIRARFERMQAERDAAEAAAQAAQHEAAQGPATTRARNKARARGS